MTLKSAIITIVISLTLLSSAGFGYQRYFEETLMLSEIVGETKDPKLEILVNLFDFDTGLTRYDIYNLSKKSEYWEMRMRQVLSVQDPQRREMENEKLLAEMMRDPTMKRIVRQLLAFGWDMALTVLGAARCVTICCY
jgi:hypothetical protein